MSIKHLVMINGPCGVGKSETSRKLQTRIPGSDWIRLDSVRKSIPEEDFLIDGEPDAVARMWYANVLGREMARAALEAGRTVILDSIKYQTEWVTPWEELGHEMGATVLDICLMAPKNVVEARAMSRGYRPGSRLNPDKVSNLYDKVAAFYKSRPNAFIIQNEHLSVEETVGELDACIPGLIPTNGQMSIHR
jgi:predicted kinase